MAGNAMDHCGREMRISVFLTCVACGSVHEIQVPPEPGLSEKAWWECFGCQERALKEKRSGADGRA